MSRTPVMLLLLIASVFGIASPAAPLDPMAFGSLGTFLPNANVVVNTAATPPTMTGIGSNFVGVVSGNIAVFCFADVNVSFAITITVHGNRPVAILSRGNFVLDGVIDLPVTGATAGAGGWNGASTPGLGFGPGGGFGTTTSHYCTAGGFGGDGGGWQYLPGGLAYGDLLVSLSGGSGGGYSAALTSNLGPGGGGGGAIELGATGVMTLGSSAVVRANGGAGGANASGGAGGGILLHALGGTMSGALSAAGGSGGWNWEEGTCGGGGGRIHTINLLVHGTCNVAGGSGGWGDWGMFGPAGMPGVVTSTFSNPVLAPSAGVLNLGSTVHGTAGGTINYAVSGHLTIAPTVIDAPAGVELSLNQSTWSQSVTINSTGDWGPTAVYARLAASAGIGPLSGAIIHNSTSAVTAQKAVTGTVTNRLTISPGVLNLGSSHQGTPGNSASYTVSGENTIAPTSIVAPAGVEISLNQSIWVQSLDITSLGSWGPVTVYARLMAAAATGPYGGMILHTSAPSPSVSKQFTGTVFPGQDLIVARIGPMVSSFADNDDQGVGGLGLVLLEFTFATAGMAWSVTDMTFSESGTADGMTALSYLALIEDTNANGTFDAGDSAAAVQGIAFNAPDGTFTASLGNTFFSSHNVRRFFLVAKLSGAASAGQTLWAELTSVSGTAPGGAIGGVPTAGPTSAIEISGARLDVLLHGPMAFATVGSNSQGPGGDGHVVLDFTLAGRNDFWAISGLQFTASGTADELSALSFLALYVDNGNGSFDGPAVDQLASPLPGVSFDAADGDFTVQTVPAAGMLPTNQARRYFLVAKLSGLATSGQTIRAALTGLVYSHPVAATPGGIPTVASSAVIIDVPVLSVFAGPWQPAGTTVLGGVSQSLVVGQLRLSATNDAVSVSAITLSLGGNADYAINASAISLYIETGTAGLDSFDTLLFRGAPGGGSLTANFQQAAHILPGGDADIWVVLELAATAGGSPAETYTISVAHPADVASTSATTLFGSILPSFATLRVVNFRVTMVTPLGDRHSGGAAVTIIGSGFSLPVTLTIGGVRCNGSASVGADGSRIDGLIVPAGTGEGLEIVLTTNDLPPQVLTETFSYTYEVPAFGTSGGGCVAGHGVWSAVLPLFALFIRRRRRA